MITNSTFEKAGPEESLTHVKQRFSSFDGLELELSHKEQKILWFELGSHSFKKINAMESLLEENQLVFGFHRRLLPQNRCGYLEFDSISGMIMKKITNS